MTGHPTREEVVVVAVAEAVEVSDRDLQEDARDLQDTRDQDLHVVLAAELVLHRLAIVVNPRIAVFAIDRHPVLALHHHAMMLLQRMYGDPEAVPHPALAHRAAADLILVENLSSHHCHC